MPVGGGEPVQADNVLCHIGAEETLEAFTENLRGAHSGEHKKFRPNYPADYPDPKLAGKTYDYAVEVQGIKEKKLPELNDEFAKDAVGESAGIATLEELRAKIRENWKRAQGPATADSGAREDPGTAGEAHDFPVPEALVEHQMDVAPGARGALACGAGRGSARGECGLGGACASASRTAPWRT